jgi:hypothetical protein
MSLTRAYPFYLLVPAIELFRIRTRDIMGVATPTVSAVFLLVKAEKLSYNYFN